MKKTCKNLLISLFLALCLAVSLVAMVACGETENEDVTYTVTVQKEDKSPVSGVSVEIGKSGVSYDSAVTDADGKVSFELPADNYTVTLDNLPEHYTAPASLTLTKEKHELNVTLNKSFTYTVKLVDTDGKPYYAPGVAVGICTDANCLAFVEINTDGVAVIEGTPDNYHVQILNLPATAQYECDDRGYYTGEEFTPTHTEMTITITTASVIDFSGEPLSAEKKTSMRPRTAHTASTIYSSTMLTK